MKRTIKFRGRDFLGNYRYGAYDENCGVILEYGTVSVVTVYGSVAQLVGYDADGNEVYEGDILTLAHDGKILEYTAQFDAVARSSDRFVQDIKRLTLKETP